MGTLDKTKSPRFGPLFLALLSLSAAPVFARQVRFTKKVNPGALKTELTAQGFLVDYIECTRDDCRMDMSDKERKDPLPAIAKYVFVDPAEVQRKKLETMRALYVKLKAGTITPAEKDDLLKMLVKQVLGVE